MIYCCVKWENKNLIHLKFENANDPSNNKVEILPILNWYP